jgi:hypothetical protein
MTERRNTEGVVPKMQLGTQGIALGGLNGPKKNGLNIKAVTVVAYMTITSPLD